MFIHAGDYDAGWDAGYEAYQAWRETGGTRPVNDAGDSFGAGWVAGWEAAEGELGDPGRVLEG